MNLVANEKLNKVAFGESGVANLWIWSDNAHWSITVGYASLKFGYSEDDAKPMCKATYGTREMYFKFSAKISWKKNMWLSIVLQLHIIFVSKILT